MRDVDVRHLTDDQLVDAVDRYDGAALTLHRVMQLQSVPGPVDYCSLEVEMGREMDRLGPAVREWERRGRANGDD